MKALVANNLQLEAELGQLANGLLNYRCNVTASLDTLLQAHRDRIEILVDGISGLERLEGAQLAAILTLVQFHALLVGGSLLHGIPVRRIATLTVITVLTIVAAVRSIPVVDRHLRVIVRIGRAHVVAAEARVVQRQHLVLVVIVALIHRFRSVQESPRR